MLVAASVKTASLPMTEHKSHEILVGIDDERKTVYFAIPTMDSLSLYLAHVLLYCSARVKSDKNELTA